MQVATHFVLALDPNHHVVINKVVIEIVVLVIEIGLFGVFIRVEQQCFLGFLVLLLLGGLGLMTAVLLNRGETIVEL